MVDHKKKNPYWRDMKMKLKFTNYMANTVNGLLAAIFKKLTTKARPKI